MAAPVSTNNNQLVSALRQALVYARAATSADHKGEIIIAIAQYKDAVVILDAEAAKPHKITDEYLTMITDRSETYKARIVVLEEELAMIWPEKYASSSKETFIFNEESPSGYLPDPPPPSILFKSFWLMKVWRNTMISGGYVTKKVYIPKVLWYQSGCKFAALQTKVQSCDIVSEVLMKIRDCGKERPDLLEKELETCCVQLDAVQNSLHFHLSFIAEVKKKVEKDPTWGDRMKKFGGAIAKGAVRLAPSQRDEGSDYILQLKLLFEESQFIEEYITYFLKANNTTVSARLRRVSDFFMDVVCQFVLRDFLSLVERYIKKNVESFIKLKM